MKGMSVLLLAGMTVVLVTLIGAGAVGQVGPDMEIVDFTTHPLEEVGIYGGMSAKVYANITNNGTSDAQNVTIHFYKAVGGGDYEEMPGSPINFEGAFPVDVIIQFSVDWQVDDNFGGDRMDNLKISIDSDESPSEMDDNEKEMTVRVRPNTPDLVVELATDFDVFVWAQDNSRRSNDTVIVDTYVYVQVTVYNLGTKRADSVKVYFTWEGTNIGSIDVGNVNAANKKPSSIPLRQFLWRTPTSPVTDGILQAYVNPESDITEGNNHATVEADVVDPGPDDLPDFAVVEIIQPQHSDPIYSYGAVEVKAIIANLGYRSNRGDPVDVVLRAGEEGSESNVAWTTIELSAQERPVYYNVKFVWRVEIDPDTDGRIIVEVDPNGNVTEEDESGSSNRKSVSFTVEEPRPEDYPDLGITDVKFVSPNGSYMGDNGTPVLFPNFPVSLHIYVKNYGVMPVADVPIDIWYGAGPNHRTEWIARVWINYLKGKTTSIPPTKLVVYEWTVPGNLSRGEWYLSWMIDKDNNTEYFNETDETGDPRRDNNNYTHVFWLNVENLPDPLVKDVTLEYASNSTEIPESEPAYYGGDGFGTINMIITLENRGDVSVTVNIAVYDEYDDEIEYKNAPAGEESRTRVYKGITIDDGATVDVTHEWYEWMRRGEDDYVHTFYINITWINSEYEKNNSNNNYVLVKTVVNKGEPDLTIGNLAVTPDYPTEGTNVTIVAPIKNIGQKATTHSFIVRYQWTSGTTGDWIVDTTGLNSWRIDRSLGSNDTYVHRIEWNWSGFKSGDYLITVYVDWDDDILESDEGNNDKTVTLHIRIDHPDIVCSAADINWSYNAWEMREDGETTYALIMERRSRIDITVHNEGTLDIEEDIPLTVSFSLWDDNSVTTEPVESTIPGGLAAEDSETISIYWTPPASADNNIEAWRMSVKVPSNLEEDPYDEPDRGNQNPVVKVLTIKDLPDVAVTAIAVTNEPVTRLTRTRVIVKVSNIGPATASNIEVTLDTVGGEEIGTKSIDNLTAGATRLLQFEWTPLQEGPKELRVQAEMQDMLELNDTNNILRTTVYVETPDKPELYIQGIITSGNYIGEEITIDVLVVNNGGDTANNVDVVLEINGRIEGSVQINTLAQNDPQTVSFKWKAVDPGNQTAFLKAIVDPDDTIDEVNNTNNQMTDVIELEEKPGGGTEEGPTGLYIAAAVAIGIGSAAAILFLMRKKA
ncbi:MAG TPA: hypothetical protein EYP43_03935 [Thermoplasmata archaeon]|nr:hypothetical protein [Thermoplasmata archaeon]